MKNKTKTKKKQKQIETKVYQIKLNVVIIRAIDHIVIDKGVNRQDLINSILTDYLKAL